MEWVEADLTSWPPAGLFDVVTAHYAHPAMPRVAFYRRIAEWLAPGGTLLIVGHLRHHGHGHGHGHGDQPPAEATVTLADITAARPGDRWEIVAAQEHHRTGSGREAPLHDAVVRAARRS